MINFYLNVINMNHEQDLKPNQRITSTKFMIKLKFIAINVNIRQHLKHY